MGGRERWRIPAHLGDPLFCEGQDLDLQPEVRGPFWPWGSRERGHLRSGPGQMGHRREEARCSEITPLVLSVHVIHRSGFQLKLQGNATLIAAGLIRRADL